MRFIRVSSDIVWHYLGENKRKKSRSKNWPIFDSDLDWRNRPPKPSIQSRDFPTDCNLGVQSFRGNSIPISITAAWDTSIARTTGFVWPVTGSRKNCRVTTVEGLPSSTSLNSSWQVFQHSIIGVPLSGVASSARQDTGNQSQQYCLHIPRNPTVTNSTDRRISSQHPQSALDE